MDQPVLSGNTKAGTAGGVFLVLLFKISIDDLIVSAVLAAVGATISFAVSVFWKYVLKRFNRK